MMTHFDAAQNACRPIDFIALTLIWKVRERPASGLRFCDSDVDVQLAVRLDYSAIQERWMTENRKIASGLAPVFHFFFQL